MWTTFASTLRSRYALVWVSLWFMAIGHVPTALAEIYLGIGPLHTLGDIKKMFPSATIERLKPAWETESDVLLQVSGPGMAGGGSVVVKFTDNRPLMRRAAERGPEGKMAVWFREQATLPDDEALTVAWVRWLPREPVPVSRATAKYGLPDRRGVDDESLKPYMEWDRGVLAGLSEDEKTVYAFDFTFTDKEVCSASIAKYGFYVDGRTVHKSCALIRSAVPKRK